MAFSWLPKELRQFRTGHSAEVTGIIAGTNVEMKMAGQELAGGLGDIMGLYFDMMRKRCSWFYLWTASDEYVLKSLREAMNSTVKIKWVEIL